jgi:hypothetical protein
MFYKSSSSRAVVRGGGEKKWSEELLFGVKRSLRVWTRARAYIWFVCRTHNRKRPKHPLHVKYLWKTWRNRTIKPIRIFFFFLPVRVWLRTRVHQRRETIHQTGEINFSSRSGPRYYFYTRYYITCNVYLSRTCLYVRSRPARRVFFTRFRHVTRFRSREIIRKSFSITDGLMLFRTRTLCNVCLRIVFFR